MPQSSAKDAAREWPRLLDRVSALVEGDWRRVGVKGNRSRLVRGPVGWWLPWVGFNRKSVSGELIANCSSLATPIGRSFSYDSDSIIFTRQNAPVGKFDPCVEGAAEQLLWWVDEMVRLDFSRWSGPERLARAERSYARRTSGAPPGYWTALSGMRLIVGRGDPLEPLDDYLAEMRRRRATADEVRFWVEFREVVVGGDRLSALRWLDARRRAELAAWKVPEDVIVDVLEGVR